MTEITDTLDESPPRRLVRTDEGRWLGGVAEGLGRYFDVNPIVYRIAFAALAFAGGTGILLYIAAVLVIPNESQEESIAVETLRRHQKRPWLLLGVGLLGLCALLALSEAAFWPGPGNIWLAALLGGAALVWWHMGGREAREAAGSGRPAPVVRPHSLVLPVLGVLLAAAGVVGLVDALDVTSVDWRLVFGGGAVLIGLAVAFGAATGRRVWPLVPMGVALLAALAVAAALPVPLSAGIGDRTERPATAADLDDHYELAVGDFDVDLSRVDLPGGRTHVHVELGVGDLTIRVPQTVTVEVDAHASAGSLDVFGLTGDGRDIRQRFTEPGTDSPSTLVLDADIGFGDLEVVRR